MKPNRYFGINNSGLSKSLEKLSSGYKINRAGDDAAGLAVSEKMRSQIAGLTQGVKNAQDGISMVQTFEGALTETDAILQRMKTLADQSANGTYQDDVDRDAIQLEFDQLNDELNQIADTDYNGVIVLNGGQMADGLKAVDGKFDYSNMASQLEGINAEKLADAQAKADKDIAIQQEVIDRLNSALADAKASLMEVNKDLSNNGTAAEWNTVSNDKYAAKADSLFSQAVINATTESVDRGAGGKAAGWSGLGVDMDTGKSRYDATAAKALFTAFEDENGQTLKDATSATVTFTYDKANKKWTATKGTAVTEDGNVDIANISDQLKTTPDTATTAITGLGGFTVKNADGTALTEAIFDSDDKILNDGDTVTLTFDNASSNTSKAPVSVNTTGNVKMTGAATGITGIKTEIKTDKLTDANMTAGLKEALDYLNGSTITNKVGKANAEWDAGTAGDITLTTKDGKVFTSDTSNKIKLSDDTTLEFTKASNKWELKKGSDVLVTFTAQGTLATGGGANAGTVSFEPILSDYSYNDPTKSSPKITVSNDVNGLEYNTTAKQEDLQTIEVTFEASVDANGNVTWVTKEGTGYNRAGQSKEIANISDLLKTETQSKAGNSGEGGFIVKLDGNEIANAIFDATEVKSGDTVTLKFTNPSSATMAPTNAGSKADSVKTTGDTYANAHPSVEIKVTDATMNENVVKALDALQGAEIGFSDSKDNVSTTEKFTIEGVELAADAIITDDANMTSANAKEITVNGVKMFAVASTEGSKISIFAANDAGTVGEELLTITGAPTSAEVTDTGTLKFKLAFDAYGFSATGKGPTVQAGADKNLSGSSGEIAKRQAAVDIAQKAADDAAAKMEELKNSRPNTIDDVPDADVSKSNAFSNATAPLTYTDHVILQAGARGKDAVDFTFKYSSGGLGKLESNMNCSARADGLNTASLSLKTAESANAAIDQIDNAINKVSMVRATFGAVQNRLEHKIDNMNVTKENMTSAESRIRDTDIAEEMMNFTRTQILAQASQSMLAQANQLPQGALQLLG